jgi:HlyD family secretion protein
MITALISTRSLSLIFFRQQAFIPELRKESIHRILLLSLFSVLFILSTTSCNKPSLSKTDSHSANEATSDSFVIVKRGNLSRSVRVSGIVGAVQAQSIVAPRLSGQMSGNMVLTKIVSSGTRVQPGDILAEFDRQTQMKNIFDKQAEYDNLLQQIRKKQAEHASSRASDETEIKGAEVDVQTARVEMRKNPLIPAYQAETNKLNLAESEARLKQLKDTFNLKREAQTAELHILEIQRDRAKLAIDYAQTNIEKMSIRSPLAGLVVLSQIRKGTRRVDPQEGDEYRSGGGIMMVVDTSHMQVMANVNQADIAQVYIGQPAEIRLDAYPEMVFPGKVEQISTVGSPGEYSKRIRNFSVLVSIQGSNPKLLPDLTAAVDLQLEKSANALLLPREAIFWQKGQATAVVLENGKQIPKTIKTGLMNDFEIAVESGLKEGDRVLRSPQIR